MPVFYFCHYFLFSQLLFVCEHTKDTKTRLGLGGKANRHKVKWLELLKQYHFALLTWIDIMMKKKNKEKTSKQNIELDPKIYVLKCFCQKTQISTRTKNVLLVNTPLCYIVLRWKHKRHKTNNFRINVGFFFCLFFICVQFFYDTFFCFYCDNSLTTSKWRFIMKK